MHESDMCTNINQLSKDCINTKTPKIQYSKEQFEMSDSDRCINLKTNSSKQLRYDEEEVYHSDKINDNSTASENLNSRQFTLKSDLLNQEGSNTDKMESSDVLENLNIEFKNISYYYKRHSFTKEKVQILNELSGEFKSGQLTAIMGASGSGKTTLLNILTGYTTLDVQGSVYDNASLRNQEQFSKKCCYIMQDNNLQLLLTVQETMSFAANLKLPRKMSLDKKQKRIDSILTSLGLFESKSTRAANLSGGERKRLSIALELIKNPPVMFFDEPTSGLDSSSSKQTITLLRKLAHEGRNIICTIHQPSATLLEQFDHLYIIEEGRCVYQGSVENLLPYLSSFEPPLICPTFHNPADYFLEVCKGEYGNYLEDLVEKSENGRNMKWRRSSADKQNINCDINQIRPITDHQIYATSCFNQVVELLKRTYIILFRNGQLAYSRLAIHILTSLFTSTLYFKVGEDAKYILDNFKYIFLTTVFNMFVSFSAMLVVFATDLPIIINEHFNRWYSVKSYYLATVISDLPVQFVMTFLYILISYFMTGQVLEFYRFCLFFSLCYLSCLVGQSFGMLISAFFKLQYGIPVGAITIMPVVAFCGFFLHMKDAPSFLHFMFHVSFIRYAIEGAVHALLGFDRPKMPCSSEYCHFKYPKRFMDQIGMDEPRIGVDFIVLLGFYVVTKVITYLALWQRIGGKR